MIGFVVLRHQHVILVVLWSDLGCAESTHGMGDLPSPLKLPERSSCLVASTPLKNISQLGWLAPIYGKIKNMFQTTNQLEIGGIPNFETNPNQRIFLWPYPVEEHQLEQFNVSVSKMVPPYPPLTPSRTSQQCGELDAENLRLPLLEWRDVQPWLYGCMDAWMHIGLTCLKFKPY